MANLITNQYLTKVQEKAYNLESDTLKVALLTSSETPSKDDTTFSATNEVSGTGYTAGGATLANVAVTQDDSGDLAKVDCDDVTWSTSTITGARYAVIYDTTNTKSLICSIDFGGAQTVTAGTFTIEWNASGIITLA